MAVPKIRGIWRDVGWSGWIWWLKLIFNSSNKGKNMKKPLLVMWLNFNFQVERCFKKFQCYNSHMLCIAYKKFKSLGNCLNVWNFNWWVCGVEICLFILYSIYSCFCVFMWCNIQMDVSSRRQLVLFEIHNSIYVFI